MVRRLEDCAYFNAGRGSVFTNAGKHEMDASVMDGTTGSAGAVCNVSNIRNPVHLAHAVASGTQHVLLCGAGAESLAPRHDIAREDDHYFFTQVTRTLSECPRIHASVRPARDTANFRSQPAGHIWAQMNPFWAQRPPVWGHLGRNTAKRQHKQHPS